MYELLLVVVIGLNAYIDTRDRVIAKTMEPEAKAYWTALVQLILILPFVGLVTVPAPHAIFWIAFVAGLSVLGRTAWYRVLDSSLAMTSIAPLTRMSSVIVAIAGSIGFGESLQSPGWIGCALIAVSAILASTDWASSTHRTKHFFAAVLVLVFAISSAGITLLQKYLLTEQFTVLSAYVLLKAFQVVIHTLYIAATKRDLTHLPNFRPFVINRCWQTVAALSYLVVLGRLSLATVAGISAMAPYIGLLMEAFVRKTFAVGLSQRNIVAILLTSIGVFLLISSK